MSSQDPKYNIRHELEEIRKTQEKQGQVIDRCYRILVSDNEGGTKGLGNRVEDLEQRINNLERFKRKVKMGLTWIGGGLSFLFSITLYYGKDILTFIKHVFTTGSTGKP